MTERKRPTPVHPVRTLVKPGDILASLTPDQKVPRPRTLLGPGEIGKRVGADPASRRERQTAHALGLAAETAAAKLLAAKGCRILALRWRSPYGEIDIVARDRTTLIFVEVKARGRLDDAAHAVSPRQRRRIAEAAAAWLAEQPDHGGLNVRFDVILVAPGRPPHHLVNAFDSDG